MKKFWQISILNIFFIFQLVVWNQGCLLQKGGVTLDIKPQENSANGNRDNNPGSNPFNPLSGGPTPPSITSCSGKCWSWESGNTPFEFLAYYGTKGQASTNNTPGLRGSASSWSDNSGNVWIFGGSGYDSIGKDGKLSDLWKFDGTNWTWIAGNQLVDQAGVYGIQGVAHADNVPGGRTGAVTWRDNSGNLWLFGGQGLDSTGVNGYLNDLWKFDGSNWIWIAGNKLKNQAGIYGTKGIANPNNIPGARTNSASWKDNSGNFWLFGGYGYDSATSNGILNDLWKFDGTNWIWIGGPTIKNQFGSWGTKGVTSPSNIPSSRYMSAMWTDSANNFWLFGGSGYASDSQWGSLNDLWKFDGTNWTWIAGTNTRYPLGIYGTKGVAAPTNMPGGRYNGIATWIDNSDNLWLFGGYGKYYTGSTTAQGKLNDLWKFDGTNWTWIAGSNDKDQPAVYGTKGVPSAGNNPDGRRNITSWKDGSDNLYLFGGGGKYSNSYNDIWKFDGTNWSWIAGDDLSGWFKGNFGTKGVTSTTNAPSARQSGAFWIDSNDNIWIFGGYGYDSNNASGRLNDLWKYDGTNWTWISGSNTKDQVGIYGTKGVADSGNTPGSRTECAFWIDDSDNLWLWGGMGSDKSANYRALNDLWKFDGTNWTWISGSDTGNQAGVYGTKGVADPANIPESVKEGPSSAIDSQGNLWLFGGYKYASGSKYYNALWKFDGTNWTWISGSNTPNQSGVYGTMGVADPANVPGARTFATMWIDSQDNIWIFGGNGYDSTGSAYTQNDLWKFDGTNWTWISGAKVNFSAGNYGTKGIPHADNVPAAHGYGFSANWIDNEDNLWLFGGYGRDSRGDDEWEEDALACLWKFDGTFWTWESGSKFVYDIGVYGVKGLPVDANYPIGLFGPRGGMDSNGNFWVFGGENAYYYSPLNTLLRYGPALPQF